MKVNEKVLWFFLVLVMVGSLTHTAWLFSLRESPDTGGKAIGYVIAIAIDVGLAGVTYGIRQRRAAERPAGFLYLAAVLAILVSVYANFAHAFAWDVGGEMSLAKWAEVDPVRLLTSAVVSIPLPLLVLALSQSVSDASTWGNGKADVVDTIADALDHSEDGPVAALLSYYAQHPTASQREAADAVGRSKTWVNSTLGRLASEGRVSRSDGTVIVQELV